MTALVKYDAARRALSEAVAVDEVKDLRDKADAMRIYAMQAKNKDMEVDAAEIRIRAERRLGELIAAQKQTGGLNRGASVSGAKAGANDGSSAVVTNDRRPKLADVGVSKDLSSRAQKLAAVPEEEFESEVGEWRERVKAEGERVTTRLATAGARVIKEQAGTPANDSRDELTEAAFAISELAEENEVLRAQIAVGQMDAPEVERINAAEIISDLRAQVKTLEAELSAMRVSRDRFQTENRELMKQVGMNAKELKKLRAA